MKDMMMWTDFYLRFPDADTMNAAFEALGPRDDMALDLLGPASPTDARQLANVRLQGEALPPALLLFVMEPPLFPRRVFAA